MNRIARWFLTVGLYGIGFAIFLPLAAFIASRLRFRKTGADVLVAVAAIMVFLGANFVVGMYQEYLKGKNRMNRI